jgi:hypothetical protein
MLTTRVQKLEDDVRPRLRAVEEQAQAVSREVLRLGGLVERLGARELPEILDKVATIEEARLQMAETHAKAVHASRLADEQVSKVADLQRNVDLLKRAAGGMEPLDMADRKQVEMLEKQIEALREAIMAQGMRSPTPSLSAPTAATTLKLPDTPEDKPVPRASRLGGTPPKQSKKMSPPEPLDHGVYRCWIRKRDKGTIMADFFGIYLSRYVVLEGATMRWFNAADKTTEENAMGTFDFSDMSQGQYVVEEQDDGSLVVKTPGGFFDCDLKENPLNPGEAYLGFGVALQKAISYGVQVYQYTTYTRGVECGAIVPDEDEAEVVN